MEQAKEQGEKEYMNSEREVCAAISLKAVIETFKWLYHKEVKSEEKEKEAAIEIGSSSSGRKRSTHYSRTICLVAPLSWKKIQVWVFILRFKSFARPKRYFKLMPLFKAKALLTNFRWVKFRVEKLNGIVLKKIFTFDSSSGSRKTSIKKMMRFKNASKKCN